MLSKSLVAAIAATALAAVPAVAGPGGGGPGGGPGGGAGGGPGAHGGGGPAGAALDARMNSMGPANASDIGIEHSNGNSVLGTNTSTTSRTNGREMDRMLPGTKASSHVKVGVLSGLTTGMTLTSNGTNVGTVQRIRTSPDGTVRVVVVQGTNGRMFAVPANKLSLVNGTLTTTARLNGINGGTFANPAIGVSQGPAHASATGIAHANSHSVLAGGTVTGGSLAGLTLGTAVQMNGNTIGTVQRIVTSNDGNVRRVLVTGTDGRMISLSPSNLTFSGGVLTTTTLRGG